MPAVLVDCALLVVSALGLRVLDRVFATCLLIAVRALTQMIYLDALDALRGNYVITATLVSGGE